MQRCRGSRNSAWFLWNKAATSATTTIFIHFGFVFRISSYFKIDCWCRNSKNRRNRTTSNVSFISIYSRKCAQSSCLRKFQSSLQQILFLSPIQSPSNAYLQETSTSNNYYDSSNFSLSKGVPILLEKASKSMLIILCIESC